MGDRRKSDEKPTTTIAEICRRLVTDVYGTQRAFGEALGISESRAGRLLTAGSDNLTLFNLLKLAKLAGLHPYIVLDAAGKHRELELLKDLFGDVTSAAPRLNERDRQTLVAFQRLPEAMRQKFREILDLAASS